MFTFIWNPSSIGTTFQVKHLMLLHVLDGGLFTEIDSGRIYMFSPFRDVRQKLPGVELASFHEIFPSYIAIIHSA